MISQCCAIDHLKSTSPLHAMYPGNQCQLIECFLKIKPHFQNWLGCNWMRFFIRMDSHHFHLLAMVHMNRHHPAVRSNSSECVGTLRANATKTNRCNPNSSFQAIYWMLFPPIPVHGKCSTTKWMQMQMEMQMNNKISRIINYYVNFYFTLVVTKTSSRLITPSAILARIALPTATSLP